MQRKQEVFNRSMSRANAMNLFIGVQNHSRNTRLAKQQGQLRQRIEQGEALVRSMENEIDNQRRTVATIGSDVLMQQSSIRALEGDLDTQRQQLAQLAEQYGRELAAQREMILSQNRTLHSLQTTKFKHDAVIDSIILLISLATVNTPVVDWPVRLLSYTSSFFSPVNAGNARLPGHSRRAALVSRLLRLASFFAVARALRVYAIKKGIHNYVGGSAAYLDIVRSSIVFTHPPETQVQGQGQDHEQKQKQDPKTGGSVGGVKR
jgi:hypothetical protein